MSVRTVEDLVSAIDRDLAWRRRELSALKFAVETSPDSDQSFMIRAAIALLYAHWEGYVKTSANLYLKYVSVRRLTYSELSSPFVAIAMRHQARKIAGEGDPQLYIRACENLLHELDGSANIPTTEVVSAESNLNYRRFRRILITIGIDPDQYETRENLIDAKLLASRNDIAHGDELWPSLEDYLSLHLAVTSMLAQVGEQIVEAAMTQAYRACC